MNKARKFIVKHFALYFEFRIFGLKLNALRCTRIMGPYFTAMGCVIGLDSAWPAFQWYDMVLLAIWAFMCWLTFPWFGFGYFQKWPIRRQELDDEQKEYYDLYNENIK